MLGYLWIPLRILYLDLGWTSESCLMFGIVIVGLGRSATSLFMQLFFVSGDFGTVVVHGETEIGKTVSDESGATGNISSAATQHLRSLSVRRVGDEKIESRYSFFLKSFL